MIDLDNPSGPKTLPEKRVLLATVLMAVLDATAAPNNRSPRTLAMEAHDFLWGERLETFLHWTDMDPQWFRKNLLRAMEDRSAGTVNHYTSIQRRTFRVNYRLWQQRYKGRPFDFCRIDDLDDEGFDRTEQNLHNLRKSCAKPEQNLNT